MPTVFLPGSTNQACSASPVSTMPFTVFSSGVSISTPRERRSSSSPARSSTCHEACVYSSAVPMVLAETTRRASPPHLNTTASSLSDTISSPTFRT